MTSPTSLRIPAPGIADTLPRWRWEESAQWLHDRESAEYARAVNAQAVLLYEKGDYDAAEPGKGHAEKAAEYRAMLENGE